VQEANNIIHKKLDKITLTDTSLPFVLI
jgi:hypothetical protein